MAWRPFVKSICHPLAGAGTPSPDDTGDDKNDGQEYREAVNMDVVDSRGSSREHMRDLASRVG
jgi:hypothetical protein